MQHQPNKSTSVSPLAIDEESLWARRSRNARFNSEQGEVARVR
jgi:hypothetical protein